MGCSKGHVRHSRRLVPWLVRETVRMFAQWGQTADEAMSQRFLSQGERFGLLGRGGYLTEKHDDTCEAGALS